MRKYLISLLLASAALPGAAMAADQNDEGAPRAERQARGDRGDRGGGGFRAREGGSNEVAARPDFMRERRGGMSAQAPQQQEGPPPARMERAGPDPQQQANRQARQVERQQRIDQQRSDQQGGFFRPDRGQVDRGQRDGWNQGATVQPDAQQGDVVREHRNRGPRVVTTDGLPTDNGGFVQRQRPDRGDVARPDRPMRGSFADRLDRAQERDLARRTRLPGLPPGTGMTGRPGGTVGPVQSTPLPGGGELRRSSSGAQWGTRWRNDGRYNWQDWRRRHRSSFHVGFYYDPFGWGYQRMNYGWTLFPSYYQSSYWLRDPWQYRLPPAYGPYRWVRYWDDALLVDTYSGEVVDVIYDFFW